MALDAFHEYPERNFLIADHAGSGKTLAYLMPIIQQLWEDEENAGGRLTQPNNPRVIILAPTAGECKEHGISLIPDLLLQFSF